jgi:hypothetical protein
MSAEIIRHVLGYSFFTQYQILVIFLSIAIAITTIKNYMRKRCFYFDAKSVGEVDPKENLIF